MQGYITLPSTRKYNDLQPDCQAENVFFTTVEKTIWKQGCCGYPGTEGFGLKISKAT